MGQLSAYLTLNVLLHTHVDDSSGSFHPYWRQRAPWKALL